MNGHDERRLVDAFVDGEVDPGTELELERHFASCPACAGAVAARRALREALRGADLRFTPPGSFSTRVASALRREAAPRSFRPALVWLAAAASLVLAFLLGTRVSRPRENDLAADVTSSHVRSLLASHLTDVLSTDRHTVKPWFSGRVDFAPPVPDLADSGFPLVGGRVDVVGGRTAAVLVYQRNRHVVDLFVRPGEGKSPSSESLRRQGFAIETWTGDGLSYWAVSDLDRRELAAFADSFRSAIR